MALNAQGQVQPSSHTGIDAVAPDQRDRILRYVDAVVAAKAAGVAGDEIRYPQAFVDRIVHERVKDAATPSTWAGRVREMDAEEAAWKLRIADRLARAVMRELTPGPAAAEACRIVKRAGRLTDDEARRLDEVWSDAVVRDADRVADLVPGIVQPDMGSLRWRALTLVEDLPARNRLDQILVGQPHEVMDAATAAFASDILPAPLYAILMGPWAAVIDGDDSVLGQAWTDEADDLRADISTIDVTAWRAPDPYAADF